MVDDPVTGRGTYLASVIIPAHDEERVIARTLGALLSGAGGELDVVVVCNGCTDRTADVARAASSLVRVLDIPEASKAAAMRAGNLASAVFPRIHMDADVELTGDDARALVRALEHPGVLAAAPERDMDMTGVSLPVRWYYDVWQALPQVRSGLFGRGVVAVARAGQERLDSRPALMSDDLVASEAFAPDERKIVRDARVVVRPPRRLDDLVRRRVRVATGNAQADTHGVRRPESRTSVGSLLRLAARRPRLIVRLPVFLAVTWVSRRRAARAVADGDFSTWERDESSRV
ncbi:MAG: glycosyltransferase [Dehalococcoidia bacterium]